MSQLSVIKERIRTIANLNKITRAMEMVTRTKIHKMRQNFASARNYQERHLRLLAAVEKHSMKQTGLKQAPQKYYLVFFAHKGFCGGFNDKLLSHLRAELETDSDVSKLYFFGRFQAKWKHALAREFQHIAAGEKTYQAETAGLIAELSGKIISGEKIAIYFVYNRLISVLEQSPFTQKIYPPVLPVVAEETLLEPAAAVLYPEALKAYLAACLDRAFWESLAGEHYSRLLSMKNANDNAELILSSLTLEYNKTRQIRITQELSEVVSAFDVLKVSAEKKERGV
jgi:F-type H+-transporting ATPase subunit gamma